MLQNKSAVSVSVATALGCALAAALIGTAGPAQAATTGTAGTSAVAASHTSHFQKARSHWKAGAEGPNAMRIDAFLAARDELEAADGDRYWHEQDDLTALSKIPGTRTTARQRAVVVRATRELNGFFHTPGLYSVKPGNPFKLARADWIKSHQVASAHQNVWVAATIDQLHSYKKRYAAQRNLLSELLEVPITDTTTAQRAVVRRNTRALNDFFDVSEKDY